MVEGTHVEPRPVGGGHTILLLSLKLILLAFFILLNSLSEFDARKTRAVLDSVDQTFKGKIVTPQELADTAASLGVLPLPRSLANEVGALFESFVPNAKARQTDRATTLRVEMPTGSLFEAGKDQIRPERKVLIRRLARALMSDPTGVRKYELAFLHGLPDGAAGGPSGDVVDLAVRRADSIAHYLVRQAIPPDVVAVALEPDLPETVVFVLRLRGPARAESRATNNGAGR